MKCKLRYLWNFLSQLAIFNSSQLLAGEFFTASCLLPPPLSIQSCTLSYNTFIKYFSPTNSLFCPAWKIFFFNSSQLYHWVFLHLYNSLFPHKSAALTLLKSNSDDFTFFSADIIFTFLSLVWLISCFVTLHVILRFLIEALTHVHWFAIKVHATDSRKTSQPFFSLSVLYIWH